MRQLLRATRSATALILALWLLFAAGPSFAEPKSPTVFENLCAPKDPGLKELSGLAFSEGLILAIGDSGSDERIFMLNADCAVVRAMDMPVPPNDIEDMATFGNNIWLSDIGDNRRSRETISLTRFNSQTSSGEVHRLVYPDGPHDAESILIGRDGVPVIVTKEALSVSGIYTPVNKVSVDELSSPGPTMLAAAGSIKLGPTDTQGGPLPFGSSTLITGGAVSVDGSVVALRTYTDVYLFDASDGDIVTALARTPVRVALPGQPQGEAITFTASGDLLAGSESDGEVLPPIELLHGATDLVV
ncbi:MAG: hypothetical protein ACRCSF_09380, partial [Mycobacteriaceae bacterium]